MIWGTSTSICSHFYDLQVRLIHRSVGFARPFRYPESWKHRLYQKVIHVRTGAGRCEIKPSGLDFDVSYIDIVPRDSHYSHINQLPVILYLTGWIGSHRPVKHFLLKLSDRTHCRVVAPLWPGLCDETRGHSFHDQDSFGHTVNEYAEFALDFLTTANVITRKQPLESIVAHSGGCLTALLLGARHQRLTKSLTLICPSAPRPISKYGYGWIHRLVAKAWDIHHSRRILKPFIAAAVYTTPFRGHLSTEAAAAIAQASLRVEDSEVLGAANDVVNKQMPILMVYSDDDEWIPLRETLTLADKLELHPDSKKGRSNTDRYTAYPGSVEKMPMLRHTVGSVFDTMTLPRHAVRIIKGGTHWPQRTCPDLVLEKIVELLKLAQFL